MRPAQAQLYCPALLLHDLDIAASQTAQAEVLDVAERIARRQDGMVAAVRAGRSVAEVMHDKEFEAIHASRT